MMLKPAIKLFDHFSVNMQVPSSVTDVQMKRILDVYQSLDIPAIVHDAIVARLRKNPATKCLRVDICVDD